ncbi:MAG: flagellar biosynthetic protein FliO [Deltaproteobacteria bacterium]|nr:flagellar biosynthetic protein FliO [Deltaproteobacteria bacterium]
MPAHFDISSIETALSLAVIICIVIISLFIIRRSPFGPLSGGKTPAMRVLGTLNLAPKRAIALVEICDQWMVIGIGTDTVTLISKLERQEESTMPLMGNQESGGIFQNLLDRIHPGGRLSRIAEKE